MLIREDLGVLLLGAREAIYALDINNISVQKDRVSYHVIKLLSYMCRFLICELQQ